MVRFHKLLYGNINISANAYSLPLLYPGFVTHSHEIGFFLLQHDIPNHICQKALSETNEFFSRPLKEKMIISYEKSPAFRGYMPLGVENTEGKIDGRDQIEYAAEYANVDQTTAQFYHRLKSTNPWPDSIQSTLKPAVMEYITSVLNVADRLRDAMCLGLGVDPKSITPSIFANDNDNIEEPNFWSMKLVSYPPVPSDMNNNATPPPVESLQGVGAHCDSNFLTLICQDPNSTGLQVQNVNGEWIDVPTTDSNILICNIGELAEIWSRGYFLATPHRVQRHTSSTHSRTSLPIFYNPKIDAVIEPITNIDKLPWERKEQNQWRRWRRRNNTLITSVGENSFKSLARSHPKVFETHHRDLRLLEDGRIIKR